MNELNPISDYVMLRLAYIVLYPLIVRYGLLIAFHDAIDAANREARTQRTPGGYPEACDMLNHYQGVITMRHDPGGEVDRALVDVSGSFIREFVANYKARQYPSLGAVFEQVIKARMDLVVTLKRNDFT